MKHKGFDVQRFLLHSPGSFFIGLKIAVYLFISHVDYSEGLDLPTVNLYSSFSTARSLCLLPCWRLYDEIRVAWQSPGTIFRNLHDCSMVLFLSRKAYAL
jgi:hypothetical protein